ncbi:polyketide synthase dehydratase domain-containing protein, partial [Streptomyces sp. CWNU-1]|nr:polyketide synthase dehydratase domain-containing protein [Streptomyces sp. CWNU-1]
MGWADSAVWPPAGATALSVDGLYDDLAERGYSYGAAFQGLSAVWREGETLYAEVSLPVEDVIGSTADAVVGYGIHPVLLDAALHPVVAVGPERGGDQVLLPFAWSGVRLHAVGARALRVQIMPSGSGVGGLRVRLADLAGRLVAEVDSLAMRPITMGQLARAAGSGGGDELFRLAWSSVPGADVVEAGRVAFVGRVVPEALVSSLPDAVAVECYPELAGLLADDTAPLPDLVIATGLLEHLSSPVGEDVPGSAR